MRHRVYAKGAKVLKIRAGKVAALVHMAYEEMPWLRREHKPLVARWAELQIVIDCCFAGLVQTGVFSIDQEKREISCKRLVHDYRMLVQTQTVIADKLLMTPAARAQLSSDGNPTDLIAMMAQADAAEPQAVEESVTEKSS
ncbi:MAG TPA: hypothetical protein VJ728_09545 [Candidatus Binataceae bacterium]|nr:hypothetical protein [Candidatus Binataceae bacterium]